MGVTADPCPCCEERISKRGGFRFVLKNTAPLDACEECVVPEPERGTDYPPFVWPRNVGDVEVAVERVLAEGKQALDKVAAEENFTWSG